MSRPPQAAAPSRSGSGSEGSAGADPASLEHAPETLRAMAQVAVERVLAHLATLSDQPACGDTDAAGLCRALRQPHAPEHGRPLDDVLEPLFTEWLPRSFTTPGPGYLAYIPGGGLFEAALADFIAGATNRYTGVWQAAPALVQLEADVLAWFAEWMDFPATTRGLLTSGGSMANFTAIVCARERHLGTRLREGVLYVSTQAHHGVAKAARLAGILPDRVRTVAVDQDGRLDPAALRAALDADRAAGRLPFCVVSSAGTTNTGAVDPLHEIADICAPAAGRAALWHHVDGAYGAFFHMVPELRPLLAGLPRADSLALDPHKGLFLPYGTGALLVRDGEDLRAAHAATAGYLPSPPDAQEFYDPSQYGPELSRPFRGLRVWLALAVHGAARFRAALLEKRELALRAAEELRAVPGLELVAPPQLSLLAFAVQRPGADAARRDADTRELLARVTARQRVMLTGAQFGERFVARICVLSFRTRAEHVAAAVEDIAAETAALLSTP